VLGKDPATKYSLAGCVPSPVDTGSRPASERAVLESESRSRFRADPRLAGSDKLEGCSTRPFLRVLREYTGW
jgi:hypothetical protein